MKNGPPLEITKDTRIADILEHYGDVAAVMEALGVKSVGGLALRKVLGKVLTVERAARVHGVPLDAFLGMIREAASRTAAGPGPAAGPSPEVDLLIIGAGPTGLAAAVDASRHGLTFQIIDKKAHRSTFSKALVVHARTLEALETMGLAQRFVEVGCKFVALNIAAGKPGQSVRVDLLEREWGDTRYPFWLSLPQFESERLLEEALEARGGAVAWNTELLALKNGPAAASATLRHQDGSERTVNARWVLSCDGGRSTGRELLGVGMDREPLGATFVLCDGKTTLDLPENEGFLFLAEDGLLLIVPMPEPGLFRLIAHVPENPGPEAVASPDWWNRLLSQRAHLEYGAHDLRWSSCFELSQGVADRYREGRVFFLGDAAHVHSPVGGQGMNTGIQDAHNLLWKLAMAARIGDDDSSERLLSSYERERKPTAEGMVSGTSLATRVLAGRSHTLRQLVGSAMSLALRAQRVQDMLGRDVGMLDLTYDHSPIIAQEQAGRPVQPGQRLPNPVLDDGRRLHDLLDPLRHTVLAFSDGESDGWDAWTEPTRKLAVGSADLPDREGTLQRLLGARPGDRLLVRPDRIVAAFGQPSELLAELPQLLGCPPSAL